jgi:hypothetical protein
LRHFSELLRNYAGQGKPPRLASSVETYYNHWFILPNESVNVINGSLRLFDGWKGHKGASLMPPCHHLDLQPFVHFFITLKISTKNVL